jgi:hypothetical protein
MKEIMFWKADVRNDAVLEIRKAEMTCIALKLSFHATSSAYCFSTCFSSYSLPLPFLVFFFSNLCQSGLTAVGDKYRQISARSHSTGFKNPVWNPECCLVSRGSEVW